MRGQTVSHRATLCTPAYSTHPFRIHCNGSSGCTEIDVVDTCGNELARLKKGETGVFAVVTEKLLGGDMVKLWRRIE